jgi:hypothetical protein
VSYRRVSRVDPRTALGFRLIKDLVAAALAGGAYDEESGDAEAIRRALKMVERRAAK